ncbi:MAG: RsmB/NOP family class I SAM-dependent RNA methyltransferase, partial [Ignavibacteria bacterium]
MGENIATYLIENFDENFLKDYENYIQSEPHYYIRSRLTGDNKKLIEGLSVYGIELEPVENIPQAYLIKKGIENIGKTFEFMIGQYYIQSLSSMIPPLVLQPTGDDVVLDLCAAPGSKTTEMSEMMNNSGTLYANEISVPRLRSLVHNLDKVNAVNTGVLNAKGELLSKVYDHYFDKILVDAPCSATGIIQKKEEVTNWWSSNQMEKIANLQLRLLIAAIKMLKVGGEIVYSTCSLTLEENELVLDRVLKKYPVELVEIELPVKSERAKTSYRGELLNPEIEKAHRIIPWQINSEGFFVAKLKKIEETESKNKELPMKKRSNFAFARKKEVAPYLKHIEEWFGIEEGILDHYKFILRGKDLFYTNADWYAESLVPFNRIGTKFGNIDSRGYAHLHTQSAQNLSDY